MNALSQAKSYRCNAGDRACSELGILKPVLVFPAAVSPPPYAVRVAIKRVSYFCCAVPMKGRARIRKPCRQRLPLVPDLATLSVQLSPTPLRCARLPSAAPVPFGFVLGFYDWPRLLFFLRVIFALAPCYASRPPHTLSPKRPRFHHYRAWRLSLCFWLQD